MTPDGTPQTGKRSVVCIAYDGTVLVDGAAVGVYVVTRDPDGHWLDTLRGVLSRAYGLHPTGEWRPHTGGDWLIDAAEAATLTDLLAAEREAGRQERDEHWRRRVESIASGLHFAGQLDAERAIRRLLRQDEEVPR